ncbi:MAG: ATP synthase F1 subunit gamma [Microgenomates group bacterium]
MASIRILRRRIKSAKNIAQITKAMELVAASKMKKAQAAAIAGKQYAQKIYEMVTNLASRTEVTNHPYLVRPSILTGKRLIILISTTKGLCGGLNSNLFRFCIKTYPDFQKADVITIGKKGTSLVVRFGANLKADFSDTVPFIHSVPAIVELMVTEYIAGKYDGVDVVYNEFKSALQQIPKKKTVLPLTIETAEEKEEESFSEFVIEPSKKEVFDALLPHYLENQIRDAVLQAEASEHSARMVAMRNATDNAMSLIDGLTLMYNKERQAKITFEIADIVTARLAVE